MLLRRCARLVACIAPQQPRFAATSRTACGRHQPACAMMLATRLWILFAALRMHSARSLQVATIASTDAHTDGSTQHLATTTHTGTASGMLRAVNARTFACTTRQSLLALPTICAMLHQCTRLLASELAEQAVTTHKLIANPMSTSAANGTHTPTLANRSARRSCLKANACTSRTCASGTHASLFAKPSACSSTLPNNHATRIRSANGMPRRTSASCLANRCHRSHHVKLKHPASGTNSLELARLHAHSTHQLELALPTRTANGMHATELVRLCALTVISPTSKRAHWIRNACGTPSPALASKLANFNQHKSHATPSSRFATGTLRQQHACQNAPSLTPSHRRATPILAANGLQASAAAKPDARKLQVKEAASPTLAASGPLDTATTHARLKLSLLAQLSQDAPLSEEFAHSAALPSLQHATRPCHACQTAPVVAWLTLAGLRSRYSLATSQNASGTPSSESASRNAQH